MVDIGDEVVPEDCTRHNPRRQRYFNPATIAPLLNIFLSHSCNITELFSSISLTFVTGDRTWSTATGMARIRLQFPNKPSRTSAAPSRSRDGQRWPGCCRPSSRSDSTQRESFQYGLKVLSTQTVFEKV